jgi:hypothetical protein
MRSTVSKPDSYHITTPTGFLQLYLRAKTVLASLVLWTAMPRSLPRRANLKEALFKLVVWPILLPLGRQTLLLSWLIMPYLGSMLLNLDWPKEWYIAFL